VVYGCSEAKAISRSGGYKGLRNRNKVSRYSRPWVTKAKADGLAFGI